MDSYRYDGYERPSELRTVGVTHENRRPTNKNIDIVRELRGLESCDMSVIEIPRVQDFKMSSYNYSIFESGANCRPLDQVGSCLYWTTKTAVELKLESLRRRQTYRRSRQSFRNPHFLRVSGPLGFSFGGGKILQSVTKTRSEALSSPMVG